MNQRHVSERDLRLFLVLDALLEHRSVTRAAETLDLTQSAVSHSLRALRARFGDPLLVRVGNALEPTSRAMSLRAGLTLGLGALERLLDHDAAFDPGNSKRCFSLACPDHPQFTLLPAIIGRIRREATNIDIRIRPISTSLADELANGKLDLVLAGAEVERQLVLDRGLMRTRIISEPFQCILRKGHPASRRALDLDAYTALPHVLVSTTGDERGIVDAALATLGRARRVQLTVPSFPAAVHAVASSDLIATLPKAITDMGARRPIVVRKPPIALPSSDAYLWWHARFQHDPCHVWWRQTLLSASADLRATGGHNAAAHHDESRSMRP